MFCGRGYTIYIGYGLISTREWAVNDNVPEGGDIDMIVLDAELHKNGRTRDTNSHKILASDLKL